MNDNTKQLQVGDLVTWRQEPKPGSNIEPLGVANCEILAFGRTSEGQEAALIYAMGHEVGALVRDLHPQSETVPK